MMVEDCTHARYPEEVQLEWKDEIFSLPFEDHLDNDAHSPEIGKDQPYGMLAILRLFGGSEAAALAISIQWWGPFACNPAGPFWYDDDMMLYTKISGEVPTHRKADFFIEW